MAGPFQSYVGPGVSTRTTLFAGAVGLQANLRIPALMGTTEEVKLLDAYDMIRGSSPTRDNQKSNEDVSSQLTGSNTEFTVQNFPIVKGDNTGTITNNPNDVIVKVNGEQVIVAAIVGLSGDVSLALAPNSSDIVTVSYFFNKTDTKVTDEDISEQADSSTTTFYTAFKPIVDGSDAGKTTTNVNDVTVKVNGSIVDVTNLDGTEGAITLDSPPTAGDTVTVTYCFNQYANTGDDLPEPGITRVIRVGLSPETSDFIETIDFAIIDDTIQWGTGFKLVTNIHTTGCEFFDDSQIVGQTVDDRMWNEDVSSQFTSIETELTTRFSPIVSGSGRDTATSDPTTVIVNVNGSPVDVRRVEGEIGKIVLVAPPGGGDTVMVTYWRSRMEDDTYNIEVDTPGATGVGTYIVTSVEDGRLGIAVPGAESVASGSFTGADYTTGPTVSKGFTVDETVTLTFTSNTQFSVTSSVGATGSTGAGVTDSTYVDDTTGLIFTLASDVLYAAVDYVEIDVTAEATFVTSVIPTTSIPGLTVKIDNTTNTCSGDSTDLIAFDKSGLEPNVGDTYYITYQYIRTDYDCKVFTKFKDITADYGTLSASNSLVLGAYLAFLNNAPALILCPAIKAADAEVAADQTYFEILETLEQDVEGVNPAVIVPLTTSQPVIDATSVHCTTQSSMRYRRERISFFGFATGTEPSEASSYAEAISNNRMIAIYPDGGIIELVDAEGNVTQSVVDGSYLAAAVTGINVSPAFDVAEPMTRKQIVGFTNLVRSLDEVTMDQTAARGVTIIERINPLVIRHGLTTDMSSILTREISITTIRDFIQQEARRVLNRFIGKKFKRNMTSDVQTALSSMLRAAVEGRIIVDFKGVTANPDETQPDYIIAEALYQPIFGVNYILVEFGIRTRF